MANIVINKKKFFQYLGKKLNDKDLDAKVSMLGTTVENVREKEFEIESLANRPDLLSEEGLARAVSAFLGIKTGLREYKVVPSGSQTIVEKSLKVWPYAVTAIVRGVKFDEENVRSIIQLQEKLGATLCRNRKKGGLGLYPLDKITLPIKFTTVKPEEIKFRPLDYPTELNGRQILAAHPTGRKYGYLIENQAEYPVFIDAKGVIMSMPPIINSHDVGRITQDTKNVFVEGTGPNLETLKTALNILVTALAEMGGNIESMVIYYPAIKKKTTTPDLTPHKTRVDLHAGEKLLGIKLTASNAKKLAARMGLEFQAPSTVLVPAWRSDYLHQVDFFEDLAIAHGYDNFELEIPLSTGKPGNEAPITVFTRKTVELLTGLGFLECNTYHLTNENTLFTKTNRKPTPIVRTKNAVNTEYSVMRNALLPGLLKVLSENKHYEYPQKLFDCGKAITPNQAAENQADETLHLALVSCHSQSSFTEAKSVLEALARGTGLEKELTLKPHDFETMIPGRSAFVLLRGKQVGIIGEVHPEVLNSFELENPVAAFELNMEELMKQVLQV